VVEHFVGDCWLNICTTHDVDAPPDDGPKPGNVTAPAVIKVGSTAVHEIITRTILLTIKSPLNLALLLCSPVRTAFRILRIIPVPPLLVLKDLGVHSVPELSNVQVSIR